MVSLTRKFRKMKGGTIIWNGREITDTSGSGRLDLEILKALKINCDFSHLGTEARIPLYDFYYNYQVTIRGFDKSCHQAMLDLTGDERQAVFRLLDYVIAYRFDDSEHRFNLNPEQIGDDNIVNDGHINMLATMIRLRNIFIGFRITDIEYIKHELSRVFRPLRQPRDGWNVDPMIDAQRHIHSLTIFDIHDGNHDYINRSFQNYRTHLIKNITILSTPQHGARREEQRRQQQLAAAAAAAAEEERKKREEHQIAIQNARPGNYPYKHYPRPPPIDANEYLQSSEDKYNDPAPKPPTLGGRGKSKRCKRTKRKIK